MDSYNTQRDRKKALNENKLENIKNHYLLENLLNLFIQKKTFFELIKYNKKLQNKMNISIEDYKNFLMIEIELILNKRKEEKCINIIDEKEKSHYYINKLNNLQKIEIKIGKQVKSLYQLFGYRENIESIYFKKFLRNNILNMGGIFYHCSQLKKVDLSNCNTKNVNDMSYMFYYCVSLEEVNL